MGNRQNKIYLHLAKMSGLEQKYVQEAFDTNWVAPLGPNVDAFETSLENYLGEHKYVTVLSSGTAALHIGLRMAEVDKGDEVICQSWTFAASANPIVYLGATPIFVDSEKESWNMSHELLEMAISDRIRKTGKKPKAIVAVDLYGMPAELGKIETIAEKYDIPLIEDAAEALGSEFAGKKCGTFGKFGVLSFNGNKMITTSGGGALICDSEKDKRRARYFATQAREPFPYYHHENIGYNYRMSNICAGIGLGQMSVLDSHILHHREIASLYSSLFKDVDGIKVHENPSKKFKSNYWLTTIVIDKKKTGLTPEAVRLRLEELNVESRHLWKPMHLQPVFKSAPAYVNGISEALFEEGLCLPSGPWVTEEDVEYIADEIKKLIHVAV